MTQITRSQALWVSVDLAKNVFQVHIETESARLVSTKTLRRDRLLAWCQSNLPPGTVIAMEACAGAHHWARQLRLLGFAPMILAAHLVEPFRRQGKRGKNDVNDAAAINEASRRPRIHTVPVKSPEQQGVLAVHRLREAYKCERTAVINTIRGLCAEFGVVFPQSPEELRRRITDAIEDAGNEMTPLARRALQRAHLHWLEIELQLAWCDEQIGIHARQNEGARQISQIPGIGPVTASALVATIGDFTQFKTASQLGCWLGMTPSQDSSGGKTRLGRITKRGDTYLRTLLIQAAKSAVMTAHKRSDPISQWVTKLKDRAGWQKACVALGHKHARIVWAMLVKGKRFDPTHVSWYPGTQPASVATMTPAH
jgi:transposase